MAALNSGCSQEEAQMSGTIDPVFIYLLLFMFRNFPQAPAEGDLVISPGI